MASKLIVHLCAFILYWGVAEAILDAGDPAGHVSEPDGVLSEPVSLPPQAPVWPQGCWQDTADHAMQYAGPQFYGYVPCLMEALRRQVLYFALQNKGTCYFANTASYQKYDTLDTCTNYDTFGHNVGGMWGNFVYMLAGNPANPLLGTWSSRHGTETFALQSDGTLLAPSGAALVLYGKRVTRTTGSETMTGILDGNTILWGDESVWTKNVCEQTQTELETDHEKVQRSCRSAAVRQWLSDNQCQLDRSCGHWVCGTQASVAEFTAKC